MFLMHDMKPQEEQKSVSEICAMWARFIVISIFLSCALLYLTTAAEFTGVRAVYEAY